MQTTQAKYKYDVGTKVVFCSKGGSSKNKQTAKVVIHGGYDESGVIHGIEFADGHQMWASLQELTLVAGNKK